MPNFEIIGLLLIVALGWWWLDSVRTRDIAVVACRRACESEGLQLLDDTVATAGVTLKRDDGGRLRIHRTYEFEYSDTGNNRRPASIVMLGHRVVVIHLDLPGVSSIHTLH